MARQMPHSCSALHAAAMVVRWCTESWLCIDCLYQAFDISKRERKSLMPVPIIWVLWDMVGHKHPRIMDLLQSG